MLSLFILALAAGLCYGDYSECPDQMTIIDGCSSHLDYLQKISPEHVTDLKKVKSLDDPLFLLKTPHLLTNMCNDTHHLKHYFMCAYTNLTACLQEANSTQAKSLPDPAVFSAGVMDLCAAVGDINGTCVVSEHGVALACFNKIQNADKSADDCVLQQAMVDCWDTMNRCGGAEAIRKFLSAGRPSTCETSGAPSLATASVVVVLGVMVAALLGRL